MSSYFWISGNCHVASLNMVWGVFLTFDDIIREFLEEREYFRRHIENLRSGDLNRIVETLVSIGEHIATDILHLPEKYIKDNDTMVYLVGILRGYTRYIGWKFLYDKYNKVIKGVVFLFQSSFGTASVSRTELFE